MKVILIDDEAPGLASLKRLLEKHCPEVDIVGLCQSADEGLAAIEMHLPQLVFLDIAMPGKNGFEMLQEISDIQFETIFVTAYDRFVLQALHMSAVDYLMKPVDEKLLIEAVARAEARIQKKEQKLPMETFLHNLNQAASVQKMKFCISSSKGFQVIDIPKIMYIEASSNYSNFHFTDRSLICSSKPIHEYEMLFEDYEFVRIHKSYMVNLHHIVEYVRGEGGSVILTGGKEIEVSRRKKEVLMSKMKKFYKY